MAYWIDDGFDSWPEVAQAGTAAAGLYVRCGTWIARNMANGRITDAVVPAEIANMHGTVEWRQRLVAVGLWATEEGGFRDLRYFDLNPTSEQIAERRKKRAAAGRKGGLARGKKQKPSSSQANASGLLQPPSLPPPSTKGEGGERPRSAPGASLAPTADAWDEDPRALREHDDEMRQRAESAVRSIADEQARRRRGAAAARAALRAPTREKPA